MGRMYLSLDEVDDPVKEVELAHREAAVTGEPDGIAAHGQP
jgi:hypothetical protein